MTQEKHNTGTGVLTREKVDTQKPGLYKVLLLNDDYTTMDFVVAILEGVFRKVPAEAVKIMLQVHNQGKGLCGVFTKEIAEAKCQAVKLRAQAQGHPLQCIMEPE